MSNVANNNEVNKNKVPDILKDTLAITGIVKDDIIDFADLTSDKANAFINSKRP